MPVNVFKSGEVAELCKITVKRCDFKATFQATFIAKLMDPRLQKG